MPIDDVVIPLPDSLAEHRQQVETLAAAGITVPTAWTKLDRRLSDYLEMKSPALSRLIESVIRPDASDDRAVLRGLAVAEAAATHASVAQVQNSVVGRVHQRMLAILEPAVADIYQRAAHQFDGVAAAFAACCAVCDPETSPTIMVGKEDAERVAWQAAEQHATRLSMLVPVVATAATLAGIPDVDNTDTVLLPLLVDTTGLHRRRVWEAWVVKDGDGRCGKWAALVALGATIRACPLVEHAPYPLPRELEHRKIQVERGMYRTEVVDPEDEGFTPVPIEGRRQGGFGAV